VPGVPLPEMSPWRRRSLSIPPTSLHAWIDLAVWELWMGMLVCAVVVFGAVLIASAPGRIVAIEDLSACYAAPPIPQPCAKVVYRAGVLNAAFTALCGVMLMLLAAWFLWELWSAVAPRPITDDFLRLLDDSFGRSWRDPRTWPWSRLAWAYGFTLAGAVFTATIGLTLWTLVASTNGAPTPSIDTSQSFRLDQ
jgi:hypothetical protein